MAAPAPDEDWGDRLGSVERERVKHGHSCLGSRAWCCSLALHTLLGAGAVCILVRAGEDCWIVEG